MKKKLGLQRPDLVADPDFDFPKKVGEKDVLGWFLLLSLMDIKCSLYAEICLVIDILVID